MGHAVFPKLPERRPAGLWRGMIEWWRDAGVSESDVPEYLVDGRLMKENSGA
jgi:uncharacterized protein YjiS (DUF1127 family)